MIVHCSLREQFLDAMICVYSCPIATKVKCKVYEQNYEKIKAILIEKKYLDKYDLPAFPLPASMEPKKTRKKKVEDSTSKVLVTIDAPKRTRRTKEQIEADRLKDEKPVAVPAKPKRTRRTKAEMEAAKGA